MKRDFEMTVHDLGSELSHINIYPLGDVHVGSNHFDEERFDKWIELVKKDEFGYVVLVGDMVDNGLKNSKTNSYEATMRPREQKEYLVRKLRPIADRILGVVRGNHEERSVNDTDDCPLYDVMAKLDLEDLYRESMNFVKVSFGKQTHNQKCATYNLVLAHGGSQGKTSKFSYVFDGADVFVTGHIHQPSGYFPSKIVIDSRNNKVYERGMIHVVVPTFQNNGGYTLRGLYMPCDQNRIPVVKLYGTEKRSELLWL